MLLITPLVWIPCPYLIEAQESCQCPIKNKKPRNCHYEAMLQAARRMKRLAHHRFWLVNGLPLRKSRCLLILLLVQLHTALDPVLGDLLPERRPGDDQQLRSLSQIPLGLHERLQDDLRLDLFHELLVSAARRLLEMLPRQLAQDIQALRRRSDLSRWPEAQVFRHQHVARGQDNRLLDAVLQLADIARPLV